MMCILFPFPVDHVMYILLFILFLVLTCITAIYSISGSGRELLEAHPTSGYEYTVYHRGRKVVDLRGGTVKFSRSAVLNFLHVLRIVANQTNQSTTFNDILFGTHFGPQILHSIPKAIFYFSV